MTRIAVTREWLFDGLTEWQATLLAWDLPRYLADDLWQ
jgi:hypothetical protein